MLTSFNLEKKPGRGEDADPIATGHGNEWWLAAFDGVGGAGADTYETATGTRTGAYLASRIAAAAVEAWIVQSRGHDRAVANLRNELRRSLGAAAEALPGNRGRLHSSMLRPLPTTVAILQVCAPEADTLDFPYGCRAIWAGDSRVYTLQPDRGLVQITRDHLSEDLDPYENLIADSPMSNYLSADGRFELDETPFRADGPFVGVTATDGCFGYVESPVVFEHLLLDTLHRAEDLDDWNRLLTAAIGAVTGDDASAAIGLFGWPSFRAAQRALERRRRTVQGEMNELEAARKAVSAARDAVERAEQALHDRRGEVWARYRRDYEGYEPREQS